MQPQRKKECLVSSAPIHGARRRVKKKEQAVALATGARLGLNLVRRRPKDAKTVPSPSESYEVH